MKILESGFRSIPKTFQSLASLIWLEIKSWDSASSQDQKSLSLSGMSTYIYIYCYYLPYLLPTVWTVNDVLGKDWALWKTRRLFKPVKTPWKIPQDLIAFLTQWQYCPALWVIFRGPFSWTNIHHWRSALYFYHGSLDVSWLFHGELHTDTFWHFFEPVQILEMNVKNVKYVHTTSRLVVSYFLKVHQTTTPKCLQK
jgi:hypothetical protein